MVVRLSNNYRDRDGLIEDSFESEEETSYFESLCISQEYIYMMIVTVVGNSLESKFQD